MKGRPQLRLARPTKARGRSLGGWAVFALAVLALAFQWAQGRDPIPSAPPLPDVALAASDPVSGLPYVEREALPPEAVETLARIEAGGPFPYERDGLVFQNREGLLPRRERGAYHEYTVPTPGESDRGARRIVTGPPPETYYTDDHYRSFRRVRDRR